MDVSGNTEAEASSKDALQANCLKLKEEKASLEKDFGLKRAKFKELFMQKEDELVQEKEKSLECESKFKEMEADLVKQKQEMDKVKSELEGVRTAAAVSENNKEEEIKNIVHNYQQELQSMQQLLREAAETASDNTAVRFESERNKLVSLNENYEEEIQELRNKLSQEREGFLSTVAKSIKRVGTGTVGSPASPASLNQEHENLEESMRKAQEDAQILKSVVVPLENEIKSLKSRLEESEAKLATAEEKLKSSHEGSPYPGTSSESSDRKSPSLPDLESITDPLEKMDKLYQYLKAEKAARTDLEMYVAVLSTQKTVLQDEADRISDELQDVCRLFEEEKQSHEALKRTWQMANDQFLESQRLMMMDLRRMEGVLTIEQQRQIAELQQQDEQREAQERKIKELSERRERQEKEEEERRKLSQSKLEQERKRTHSRNTDSSSEPTSSSDGISQSLSEGPQGQTEGASAPGDSGLAGPSSATGDNEDAAKTDDEDAPFIDSGVHDTQNLPEASGGSDGTTNVRISPEKMLSLPSLTPAQVKAITDPTPETEAHKSLMASVRSKTGTVSLEGKRLVSEREWALLQEEMKASREKLGRPCSMCSNYEAQLQSVQEELKAVQAEAKSMERSFAKEEQTNKNLLKYQSELEEALKNASEDAQSQITHLTNKVIDCEKYIQDFKQQMTSTHMQLQDHCKSLSENREAVHQELIKLQAENDSLVDKYSKTAQQLQNEDINLPNNLEEMQLLLLKYREEIISAKVAKDHVEETLKSEIAFLKSQVTGEQQERVTLEETLTQEITSLQTKLTELETAKKELEQESNNRAEAETKVRELETTLKGAQTKSKQIISKLQEKLEELDKRKSKLESENHSMKGKVQSLQVDLDNSEAVQRDFVKLSQSLQIQLEKIRQAENEVRWQHEDDIDDCSNCKQPFSVTKRKHHCRHCGKIFCSDCTTKSVNSGPNFRPTKVCDVCHTILVKDATPYFSTEPPATPD